MGLSSTTGGEGAELVGASVGGTHLRIVVIPLGAFVRAAGEAAGTPMPPREPPESSTSVSHRDKTTIDLGLLVPFVSADMNCVMLMSDIHCPLTSMVTND